MKDKSQNYFEYFNSAREESGKTIKDLESDSILSENAFYDFKTSCPSTKSAIAMANYFNMSLDYILEKTDVNIFKRYKINQEHFYVKLLNVLNGMGVERATLTNELHISRSTFKRWRDGAIPSFEKIIEIASFLGCMIDDLLETEKENCLEH